MIIFDFVLNPASCSLLSVNEKRQLVLDLARSPDTIHERMSRWTCREVREILFTELAEGLKYDNLSKVRLLDRLIKLVSGSYKRRRQKDDGHKSSPDLEAYRLCQNPACRAKLNPGDKFCSRCSCCICFKYDDNKDPSLWLVCTSDESVPGDSCGLSSHLVCVLNDKRSGILQSGQSKTLDAGYYCARCGKENGLLGFWKKQMLLAKNARRLDELCYRIFLSYKILLSSERYSVLHGIVDTAVKKLEAEFGPITSILNEDHEEGHTIVGRLSVGVEVQKICACALDALQSIFSGNFPAELRTPSKSQNTILGNCWENSVARLERYEYPRVPISDVHAEKEIITLTSGSSEDRDKDGLSKLKSPAKTSLHLDSSNLIPTLGNQENLNADASRLEKELSGAQAEGGQQNHGRSLAPTTENETNGANATSSKEKAAENQDGPSKPAEAEPGNSTNKSPCTMKLIRTKDERSETQFEYCVKVIRQLECEDHIDTNFRKKFLTWFSLRSTSHQRRTVYAFVDSLIDDPASLADQLTDTFSDTIFSKRPHPVPSGPCMHLWH